MKIRTVEVARRIGIHPAQLLLNIAELGKELPLTEIWPEIDEGWVKALSAPIEYVHHACTTETQTTHQLPSLKYSNNAIHVLDKLSRQSKWGSASVTIEALQNIAHISKRDMENVVAELRRADFLDHDGSGRGTISLSSGKRKDIENVLQQYESSRMERDH
jgi:hypothetical protein